MAKSLSEIVNKLKKPFLIGTLVIGLGISNLNNGNTREILKAIPKGKIVLETNISSYRKSKWALEDPLTLTNNFSFTYNTGLDSKVGFSGKMSAKRGIYSEAKDYEKGLKSISADVGMRLNEINGLNCLVSSGLEFNRPFERNTKADNITVSAYAIYPSIQTLRPFGHVGLGLYGEVERIINNSKVNIKEDNITKIGLLVTYTDGEKWQSVCGPTLEKIGEHTKYGWHTELTIPIPSIPMPMGIGDDWYIIHGADVKFRKGNWKKPAKTPEEYKKLGENNLYIGVKKILR